MSIVMDERGVEGRRAMSAAAYDRRREHHRRADSVYLAVRYAVEQAIAAILLLALAPALVVLWACVRLTTPGPGLFWSQRVGRYGAPFWMPKLRTMRDATPLVARERLHRGEHHVTPLGRFLRRTSLDELPQLFCIALGKMSFVGPRPLLSSDQAHHIRQRTGVAYLVRPGLTGLAQVRGRNFLTERTKVRCDEAYVRRLCLTLDTRIVLRTLPLLLSGKGVL